MSARQWLKEFQAGVVAGAAGGVTTRPGPGPRDLAVRELSRMGVTQLRVVYTAVLRESGLEIVYGLNDLSKDELISAIMEQGR